MAWPTDITAMDKARVLEVAFDDIDGRTCLPHAVAAIDGSKYRAVNAGGKNFTRAKSARASISSGVS